MGLTMHSPGGVPGVSSAIMWNHTAAERHYGEGLDLLTPLVVAGATALSLSQVGAAGRLLGWAGRTALYHGTRPRTWAAYNVYKESTDLHHWLHGGEMQWGLGLKARPISSVYFPFPMVVPFPWVSLNPVEGSSSKTYQQNGGPSAPLVQKGKGSQPLTLPAAKPSAHGGRGSGTKSRRKRCPPGHRWNGRFCVPILRIDDDMKRFHDKWYRS